MKKRKNLPRTALPRLYYIDEEIAAGKYPNTKALARGYETSESSISRDIDFMRSMLDAPIEYDYTKKGYYYTEKTFRLKGSFTTAENIQALGMAKALLTLYRETPIYAAAEKLLESITAPFVDKGNPDFYENRIVVPPAASAPVDPEAWNIITSGLKANTVLAFDYKGAADERFNPRRARPYQLLFDGGAWYLYGHDEDRGAVRIFSLARLKNIKETEDHFSLPSDYDYRKKNAGSMFGVFSNDKSRHFSIELYDESALLAAERRWASDQKIKEITGGIVITFTSTQYAKILEWVLSQGGNARPLEPAELVRDWKANVKCMTEALSR